MSADFGTLFEAARSDTKPNYRARGIIADDDRIYPLGTDTKVLSTVFEAFTRPMVHAVADKLGMVVAEPPAQNTYPDFTLSHPDRERDRIAVDVKTTYYTSAGEKVSFTLGSYTSFIHPEQEGKSILFPFSQYAEHWVVGYVYRRLAITGPEHYYPHSDLDKMPLVFDDVTTFVRRKWEIAGDRAGSGNTANIGSVKLRPHEFATADPLFANESEFLKYWRGYARTKSARADAYGSLEQFRAQTF